MQLQLRLFAIFFPFEKTTLHNCKHMQLLSSVVVKSHTINAAWASEIQCNLIMAVMKKFSHQDIKFIVVKLQLGIFSQHQYKRGR